MRRQPIADSPDDFRAGADLTIYVVDIATGEKIPRKGRPDITWSDLLVINKIDFSTDSGR